MKRIFLIRHGETEWNRAGRFQGQRDVPLSDLGRRQAMAVAEVLSSVPFRRVVASSLSRAVETARPLADRLGLAVEPVEAFKEIGHGDWEGMTAAEVERRHPGAVERWHTCPGEVTMPGGESLSDVSARAWPAFLSLFEDDRDPAALFIHDAVLKVILCNILAAPLGSFWRFQIANGSVTVAEMGPKGLRIALMGYTAGEDLLSRPEQKGL